VAFAPFVIASAAKQSSLLACSAWIASLRSNDGLYVYHDIRPSFVYGKLMRGFDHPMANAVAQRGFSGPGALPGPALSDKTLSRTGDGRRSRRCVFGELYRLAASQSIIAEFDIYEPGEGLPSRRNIQANAAGDLEDGAGASKPGLHLQLAGRASARIASGRFLEANLPAHPAHHLALGPSGGEQHAASSSNISALRRVFEPGDKIEGSPRSGQ